jgi:hypothetical protein
MEPGTHVRVAPGGWVKIETHEDEPGATYHGISGKESHKIIFEPVEMSRHTRMRYGHTRT